MDVALGELPVERQLDGERVPAGMPADPADPASFRGDELYVLDPAALIAVVDGDVPVGAAARA